MRDGRKDLEVRTADWRRLSIKVGDCILFNNTYARLVKEIRRYASFEEMLRVEDPNRILPGYSREAILLGLRSIYPEEAEARGVLVFELLSEAELRKQAQA